jgi:hypothetical protein
VNGDGQLDIVTGGPDGVEVLFDGPSSNLGGAVYDPPFLSKISSNDVPGTELDITGAGFTADTYVVIGSSSAPVLRVSPDGTEISVMIPAGTGTNLPLFAGNGDLHSNSVRFDYAPPGYVNSAWATLPSGTVIDDADPNVAGPQSAVIGTTAFATLQGAIDAMTGAIDLLPGSYPDPVTFSRLLSIQVTQGTATISCDLTGTAALVKSGAGTLALTGNDADAGAQVSAGALLLDGTMTSSAPSSFPTGTTLAGAGTITGAVTSNGLVTPGDAAGVVGTLTTGALTLGSGFGPSTLSLDLISPTSYDRVVATSLNLSYATLSINVLSSVVSGEQFTIVSVAGTSGGVTGSFVNLPEGGTIQIGGQLFRINYAAGDGNDVVFTDVTPVTMAAGPIMNSGNSYVTSHFATKQHSMVESIAYSFGQAVSLSASNFTLTGINGTTTVPNVNLSSSAGGTLWTVTFSGDGVNGTTHSIGDGEYSLVLSGVTGVHANTYDFYRLLGDMDGSGTVNTTDFTTFISTFLRAPTDPFYLGAADFDGSGTIDSTDFTQFVGNFLKSVPSPLPN